MTGDDGKFEEFLREFEPIRPKPLPVIAAGHQTWRRWAAAAVIFAAASTSLWLGSERTVRKVARHDATNKNTPLVPPTMHAISSTMLTRAALEDREQFETETDALARSSLPGFEGNDSTLSALAKQ